MTNSSDRINKFAEEQVSILTSSSPLKIISEIGKLKEWLIKHQDDAIPDGAKNKLLTILEKYNRAAGYYADIRPKVIALYENYLALPEGKLLSSKDKSKVLNWFNNMNDIAADNNDAMNNKIISTWTMEGMDSIKNTISLLNINNSEEWLEDFNIDLNIFSYIKDILLKEGEDEIVIELDDNTKEIMKINSKDIKEIIK